ncbi:MAG: hypothetical protein WAW85_10910 [Gordonia sp. (in: high G+C Gram-positive bacteria)]|uniref:hypothetical protein n=1 Tax=Gordonia sp. (in: high G+C Gram-positive bacteria) TaxID=84139 RepID=UPI003BB5FD87
MAESKKPGTSRAQRGAEVAEQKTTKGGTFVASPEAKSTALKLRIVAMVLWIVAIGLEIFTIVWALLPEKPVNTWLIIGLIVAIAVLTLGGSLLWKKANRFDPASEKDKTRFFIQNQLGVIMTVLAFLPLIVLIFLDKDMDGKQKGILGAVAIVVALVVGVLSFDKDAPSVEQYSVETNVVQELTGKDEVFWVKGGAAFHVCREVSDLRRSDPNKVEGTTVAVAHQGGIARLTKKWVSEAYQCGYTTADVDRVLGNVDDVQSTLDENQVIERSGELEVAPGVVDEQPNATPQVPAEETPAVPVPAN